MYIINNFVFGHDLTKNEEIYNSICEIGFEFHKKINSKMFELSEHYHGDCGYPLIFGHCITDDDGNKDYIKEIRNAKKEDYNDGYNEFLEYVKKELVKDIEYSLKGVIKNTKSAPDKKEEFEKQHQEYVDFVDKFVKYLDNTEAEFYDVETSS